MINNDVTQISLGKFKVGITGLKSAIEELQDWRERPDGEIAQALFDRLKPQNYIPASAQEEYKRAFLREYKKALGEQVEEERQYPSIKILGPGCSTCQSLEQAVLVVLSELNLPADVEHVKDMNEIASYGVFSMPVLIINDEVKSVGKLPTRDALKKWLLELQAQTL